MKLHWKWLTINKYLFKNPVIAFNALPRNKRVKDEMTSQGWVLLGTERCLFAMDMGKHFSYILFFSELRGQIQSCYNPTVTYFGKTFAENENCKDTLSKVNS